MSSTSDKLLNKFETLKTTFFAEYVQQVETNRRFYDRDFRDKVIPSEDSEGLTIVIPMTARRAIDEAVDHILYTPNVKVPARPGDLIVEQERAEKKRQFFSAFWHQVENTTNPLGDGRKALANEGRICVKHTLRWDLIPDKPEDKADKKATQKYRRALAELGRYEFLWCEELLDNTTVFEDPSNHRDPAYVYVSYNTLTENAKVMFPDATGEWTAGDDFSEVRYLEYWSKPKLNPDGTYEAGEYYQWINGECVTDEENPYPYLPIAIEDAGFGHNRPRTKAHERYVGMSQHAQDIFIAQARQWTTMQNVSEISGFPPIFTRNMDPARTIRVGPRTITPLAGTEGEPNAEDVTFAQWPPMHDGVLQMIARTEAEANSALKMNVMGGMAQPGVDTATEADQQIQNASAKLSGMLAAMKRLVTRLNKWTLMDIEMVLEAPVTVFGGNLDVEGEVTIGPNDIRGFYETRVEMRTTDDDAVAMVKARFWAEIYRTIPFFSAFSAMERGNMTDNPTLELTRRAGEDVFLSEEFRAMRVLAAATAAMQQQQLAMARAQGMAGQPGSAPQGDQAASAPADGMSNPLDAMMQGAPGLENPAQATLESGARGARDVNQGAAAYR